MNFQMFNLDLEKAEEPEIKLPTSIGSSKKQARTGQGRKDPISQRDEILSLEGQLLKCLSRDPVASLQGK